MRTLALAIATVIPVFAAVDFEKDVKPIFREHCWECHGPTQQNGSLRLDKKASAMVGGGRVDILAGLPDRSRVYRRVAGIDRPQMPPETPLTADLIETIKQWIQEGAEWPDDAGEVTWKVDPRLDALLLEIRAGNFADVRTAVTASPELALARDAKGVSLLRQAALSVGPAEVAWLISQKADVNAADRSGLTPLMVAIEDAGKVKSLLDAGANPNAHSVAGRTALINASDRKRAAPVIKLLIEHEATTARETGQADPLLQVTRNGDLESMKLLVATRNGKFPREALSSAALSNCMECLQLVLSQNPSKQTISDTLVGAAIIARTEVLAVLIAAGADVNVKDKEGKTPLMKVVYSDYADPARVQLLLDHGADVNVRATDGDSALKEASQKGSTKVLAMLIAAGAKE
jgi:ankyrin repeat protein